jgi:predicted SnoaL-like aldol condensation-catalyzing enzyme
MASGSSCFFLLIALSASVWAPISIAGTLEENNKQLVLEFHERVLNARDPDAASRYIGDIYVQHNPRLQDGLPALQAFLLDMRTRAPLAHATVRHVVAEGDLVVLHAHVTNGPTDRGMAVVDMFRVKDGKLVEHWDVFQPVPESSVNANGMF